MEKLLKVKGGALQLMVSRSLTSLSTPGAGIQIFEIHLVPSSCGSWRLIACKTDAQYCSELKMERKMPDVGLS